MSKLPKGPLLISHRGGSGLYPENTMIAFQNSVNLYQADVLELDLHASRDGELIVIHDDTVDRTTNGSGRVGEMTLEQIKQLDAGWHFTQDGGQTFPFRGKGLTIPTLKEVFNVFQDVDIWFNVEIKRSYPYIENRLYNLILGKNMTEKVLVIATHVLVRNKFRRLNKRGIAIGAHWLNCFDAYLVARLNLAKLFQPEYDVLQIPLKFRGLIPMVNEGLVSLCNSRNIQLHVWTINDVDTMKKLLDIGVHGIITDYPDRLRKLI